MSQWKEKILDEGNPSDKAKSDEMRGLFDLIVEKKSSQIKSSLRKITKINDFLKANIGEESIGSNEKTF